MIKRGYIWNDDGTKTPLYRNAELLEKATPRQKQQAEEVRASIEGPASAAEEKNPPVVLLANGKTPDEAISTPLDD